MKQALKGFLQSEETVKEATGMVRTELNQKINVAACRIKITISRRTKHLQTMHAKALAQCRDFGAVLFDEADHGALESGLCSRHLG